MANIRRPLNPQYLDDLIASARATRANPYSEGKLQAADVMVPLDDVTRDESLQPRDGLKETHTRALVAAIEEGVDIPPVVLYQLGDELVLADGWHRYAAHQRAGKNKIRADIYEGDREDAVAHAGAANVGDKLGLTASEKVRFLRALLKLPKYAKGSDRALARMCGTSPSTVAKYKREMQRGGAEGVQNGQVNKDAVSPAPADPGVIEGVRQHLPAPGRVIKRGADGEDEIKPRPVVPGELLTYSIPQTAAEPAPAALRYVEAYTSRKRVVGIGYLRDLPPASIAVLTVPVEIPSGFLETFEPTCLVPGGWLILPLATHSEAVWAALDKKGLSLVAWATNPLGDVWMVWGSATRPRGLPRRITDLGELVSALDAGSGQLVELS